jgi:hypothetical protein
MERTAPLGFAMRAILQTTAIWTRLPPVAEALLRRNVSTWDEVRGGRCRTRYADTMNPQIVCTGCNNKVRTLADITTHDDVGEVFICQVCGNQYGRESAGAALVLLPPKSTDLPLRA